MTDITERLRLRTDPTQMLMVYPARPAPDMLCHEAANKIERLREVVLLGVNARKCQVTYFKTRNRDALLVSKDAERAFDDAARVALEAMKYKTERT
jgi:hypothetical protein